MKRFEVTFLFCPPNTSERAISLFFFNFSLTPTIQCFTSSIKSMLTRRKFLTIFSSRNVSKLISHQLYPNALPHPIQNPFPQISNNFRVLLFNLYGTQDSKFPEYEMPAVTWGVIQGRKEKLVSRVIIFDYLKGLGIIPD